MKIDIDKIENKSCSIIALSTRLTSNLWDGNWLGMDNKCDKYEIMYMFHYKIYFNLHYTESPEVFK